MRVRVRHRTLTTKSDNHVGSNEQSGSSVAIEFCPATGARTYLGILRPGMYSNIAMKSVTIAGYAAAGQLYR